MPEQKKEPTATEAMLFFSIVKNTRNKADVDWEAVANESGFKNAEVAKVRFGQIKRKLGIAESTTSSRTTPKKGGAAGGLTTPSKVSKTPKTPKTPRSTKKSKAKVKNEDEVDDVPKQPNFSLDYHPAAHKEEEDEEEEDVDRQIHAQMFSMKDFKPPF